MGIDARLPIPTTAGWLPAGMIKPGDEIFSFSGQPVRVLSVQQYTPPACYKLLLRDGLTLVVDARTGIPCYDFKARRSLNGWSREQFRSDSTVLHPLGPEAILSQQFGRCRVPVCQPLRPPERYLPVDPYIFGRWLTDRSQKRSQTRTDVIRELLERYLEIPTHIPEEYLFASFEQRLALLRGIVSTKPRAFRQKTKRFTIDVNDRRLARQIQGLLESFGIQTRNSTCRTNNRHRIMFRTILRLSEDQVPVDRPNLLESRRIEQILSVPVRECVYIMTDDPNNTFLVSEGYLGVSL